MKKKFNLGGQEVFGEEVEFEVDKENWNTYILHDGTKVRLKAVVSNVVRLEVYKPDGEPVYLINSSNVVSADVPESLKRKQEGK